MEIPSPDAVVQQLSHMTSEFVRNTVMPKFKDMTAWWLDPCGLPHFSASFELPTWLRAFSHTQLIRDVCTLLEPHKHAYAVEVTVSGRQLALVVSLHAHKPQ